METSLPNWEPKSEDVSGSVELQKEEAKPLEVPELKSKREDKFEFDLMVKIHVISFQITFPLE